MHRNTFLLMSVLAVVAALLVGVKIGQTLLPQSVSKPVASPTPTPEQRPTTMVDYTSSFCGISLEYPDSLTRMDSTGSAMFVSATNATDSVALVCQKNIPRPLVSSTSAEPVIVASISAKLYHDTSGPNKQPIDKIIFTNPKTGLDILLAGNGPVFQAILQTLHILP